MKLINISIVDTTLIQNFDFSLNIENTTINNYLVYIYIINIYNKIKNKTKI